MKEPYKHGHRDYAYEREHVSELLYLQQYMNRELTQEIEMQTFVCEIKEFDKTIQFIEVNTEELLNSKSDDIIKF